MFNEFEGYVNPDLKAFLDYDGPNLSAEIGDAWKDVELEMKKDSEGVFVVK